MRAPDITRARGSDFDYTEAERAAIVEAVQVLRPGPMSDYEYRRLRGAAIEYQVTVSWPDRKERARAMSTKWQTVADLSNKLRRALSDAGEYHHADTREGYRRCDRMLAKTEDDARVFATPIRWSERQVRENYYAKVLSIWTDLGGKLGISRHTESQAVRGPLVRYFQAVTGPAMGADAPRPNGIASIVARHKPASTTGSRPKSA